MRAPSVKTLSSSFGHLSPADARLIRAITAASTDGKKLKKLIDARVPRAARYAGALDAVSLRDSYGSQPERDAIVLTALNAILGTHGVQEIGPRRYGDYAPAYAYLNTGDPYDATLIYDRGGDRIFVGSWGDLVEEHPEWEPRDEHATIRRGPRAPKSPAQLDREISRALPSYRGGR